MTPELLADLRQQMERTLAAMRQEFARVRTGRASTALLEGIVVEYFGTKTPLNRLAGLSAPEPRLLVISPYDRSAIGDIERAIFASDLGLTPQNDGKVIRIPIPEPTEERRRELVKHVRRLAENYRVSVRNHRRDTLSMLKDLEEEGEVTEDERRQAAEKVEAMTREYVEKVDKVLKAKEEEIMAV